MPQHSRNLVVLVLIDAADALPSSLFVLSNMRDVRDATVFHVRWFYAIRTVHYCSYNMYGIAPSLGATVCLV